MTKFDMTHFRVTGDTAKAFEDWDAGHQAVWQSCKDWVHATFGERGIYGQDRHFAVALEVKENEIVPKGLRLVTRTVGGGDDGPIDKEIYVPDKRNKIGREIATKMESFTRPSLSGPAKAAMGDNGDTSFYVRGRDGNNYFVDFKIHKIAGMWYCHVPTRCLEGRDRPSGRVDEDSKVKMSADCVVIPEWEWQKAIEENKKEEAEEDDA